MQLSCNCCTKAEYFQVCYFLKNDKTLVSSQGTGRELLLQNRTRHRSVFVQSRILLLLKDEDLSIKSYISIWEAGWRTQSHNQTPLSSAGDTRAVSTSACGSHRALQRRGVRATAQRQLQARGPGAEQRGLRRGSRSLVLSPDHRGGRAHRPGPSHPPSRAAGLHGHRAGPTMGTAPGTRLLEPPGPRCPQRSPTALPARRAVMLNKPLASWRGTATSALSRARGKAARCLWLLHTDHGAHHRRG